MEAKAKQFMALWLAVATALAAFLGWNMVTPTVISQPRPGIANH